ncbi:Uncharacterised protein [Vibrio cholerae]|nr:Uncharacterised protein [Vibrio cholerae]
MAVRLRARDCTTVPARLTVCKRLSPVPVLPPNTIGVPSGSLNTPEIRLAVPLSTT